MHFLVDPHRFTLKPMSLLRLDADDYAVQIDDLTAGRILRTVRPGKGSTWLWTLTGPYCIDAGAGSSGESPNLTFARHAIRAAFDAWHAWALEQEGEAAWHG